MQLKSKIVKILCCVLVSVPLLIPFLVSAEVIDSSKVIGINVWTTPVSEEPFTNNNTQYFKCTAVVNVEFELDQSYLGWANIGFTIKYKGHNYTSFVDYTKSWSGNYYVNGTSILIEVPLSWNTPLPGYYMGSGHLPSSSSDLQNITYSNQGDVTPIGDLSTLQDILDVLMDIQQNVEIDILDELQNITQKTSLADDYLEFISKYRQWQFPIESYQFVSYWFSKNRTQVDYYTTNNYYKYPRFEFTANDYIIDQFYVNASGNTYVDMILLIQTGNSTIQAFTTNMNTLPYENINYFVDDVYGYSYLRRYTFNTSTSGNKYIRYPKNAYVTPIFIGYSKDQVYRISTDFALTFGLNNKLLNNLNIIAQGTTSSNNSSSSLDSQNTQFSTDSSNLINIEDTMQHQMNNSLNNINVNMDIGNTFGSKFLTSAEWVRNQYNTLTQNTPFGSIVSFSLLVGLALLLMGKFL